MATAPKIKDDKALSGPQKAAIFMLALGADDAAPLWNMFDEDEIRELSQIMSSLGTVQAGSVEKLYCVFAMQTGRWP